LGEDAMEYVGVGDDPVGIMGIVFLTTIDFTFFSCMIFRQFRTLSTEAMEITLATGIIISFTVTSLIRAPLK